MIAHSPHGSGDTILVQLQDLLVVKSATATLRLHPRFRKKFRKKFIVGPTFGLRISPCTISERVCRRHND
jgi:hypothetical protein